MENTTIGSSSTLTPAKVIPLLAATSRIEELLSAFAVRLDPIVQHAPTEPSTEKGPQTTVTSRLQSVGDSLQYLLDHIEL